MALDQDYLRELVVIITGASSGLGAGCAFEFARTGSRLLLTGRNEERLEETARKCRELGLPGERVFTVLGDVTIKEDVERIVASAVSQFGKIDVLINNAGATRARTLETCEIEDLDWVYNVLVRSVFMMSKACIPHLAVTRGTIINMSSVAGLRPLHFALPYSMCKNMVDRFTQASVVPLGGKGIRINNVNPATIKTDLFLRPDGPGGDAKKAAAYLDWSSRIIPAGRCGEVYEAARTVLFLASKEARFLTGVLFAVDGSFSNTSYIPKPRS